MSKFYQALLSHYDSKVNEALATLDLYLNKSVGIGEHSDILEEIKKYTAVLDDSHSKLETLKVYFDNNGTLKT
jgi:hypothetical protein